MATNPSKTSESIRQKGNEHFKAGRYTDAASLYRKAAQLAPQEIAPQTNLSIALYELAHYNQCDQVCTQALTLLQGCAQDAASKQKIYLRQAKARCAGMKLDHLEHSMPARARYAAMKLDQLEHFVNVLVDSPDKRSLQQPLEAIRAVRPQIENAKAIRTRLILDLPRYKPMVRTVPEYYTFGHDTPQSLYHRWLLDTGRDEISLMFAGIGDARNLFHTLIDIASDRDTPGIGRMLFHFTILDIKPATIARDLVLLLLLSDIAADMGIAVKYKLLPCLCYTYMAPVMPRGLYDVLQKRIKILIQMLEGQQELPSYLDVPSLYRPEILRVLRQWQVEAGQEYPTARMRRAAIVGRRQTEMQGQHQLKRYGIVPPPRPVAKGCAKEKDFYEATGLLPLTSGSYKEYRPELRACIDGYNSASSATARSDLVVKACKIVDDTWAPNVTFVDLDWERNKSKETFDIDVSHNMYQFADQLGEIGLVPKNPRGLFDYVELWFFTVAGALGGLQQRLKIEACVGDVAAVLEQIRYGVTGHRVRVGPNNDTPSLPSSSASSDSGSTTAGFNGYPQGYDRIHLSNIPDYIGGSLSSYLYALPALYRNLESYITSTNLRNPTRFNTMAAFDNEYVALSAPADLAQAFLVCLETSKSPSPFMPTGNYNIWQQKPNESSRGLDLMTRDKLEQWLQRIFLKIAMPMEKHIIQSAELIYSPLNFTIFFRLLTHLHQAGYPAHWLSGIWSEILSGKLRTSARPPRTEPLSIKEVRARMPIIEHSTAPFVAELTTLTAMWQPVLSLIIPMPNLPWIQDVHIYSLRLKHVSDEAGNNATFVLVFFDQKLSSKPSLRPYLIDDELGLAKKSPEARNINERGLHVIITWKYDEPTKTATFWLRKDVMNRLTGMSHMRVAIWRTDNWKKQSLAQKIEGVRDHGSWIGGENELVLERDVSSVRDEDEDEVEWKDGVNNADDGGGESFSAQPPGIPSLREMCETIIRSLPGDLPGQ